MQEEKTKRELKLYIWTEFEPDYSNGLAFAIAETVEEAQEMIMAQQGYEIQNWGKLEINHFTKCVYSETGGS